MLWMSRNFARTYLNVIPLCDDITDIACSTALRESLENTAGWFIHSSEDSSSESRAATVLGSMPGPGENTDSKAGVVAGELPWLSEFSGPPREAGGGKGGSPPLPNPLNMVRVSFRRACARSC